jgi:hypothetical protein
VSQEAFKSLLHAQELGLLQIEMDTAQQRFNRAQAFSWGQMLSQTTGGVINKARVRLTPLGIKTDATASLPVVLRIKNCLRIRSGTYKITKVVKNELRKKSVTDFAVVFVTYTAQWNPIVLQYLKMWGRSLANERKAITLLKYDQFTQKWSVVDEDVSDAGRDFQTNRVARTLSTVQ